MSPTVFKYKNYRFFFFSREESRMHIHVISPKGEAKFWIEPTVSLANFDGFSSQEIKRLQIVVENKANEIKKAWKKHFAN